MVIRNGSADRMLFYVRPTQHPARTANLVESLHAIVCESSTYALFKSSPRTNIKQRFNVVYLCTSTFLRHFQTLNLWGGSPKHYSHLLGVGKSNRKGSTPASRFESAYTVIEFGTATPIGIVATEVLRRYAAKLRTGIYTLYERLCVFPQESSELINYKVACAAPTADPALTADVPELPVAATPAPTLDNVLQSMLAVHTDVRRLLPPTTSPQPYAGNHFASWSRAVFPPKHLQQSDAYIIRQLEESPLKAAMLANDVGTVLMYYQHCKDMMAQNGYCSAYPTLVLMPSSLVAQTFYECEATFGDMLSFRCFFGYRQTKVLKNEILSEALPADNMKSRMESYGAKRYCNVALVSAPGGTGKTTALSTLTLGGLHCSGGGMVYGSGLTGRRGNRPGGLLSRYAPRSSAFSRSSASFEALAAFSWARFLRSALYTADCSSVMSLMPYGRSIRGECEQGIDIGEKSFQGLVGRNECRDFRD
ncbi:hypothetical protein QBC45DRAFT_437921 [Copromyces sp. CBS 386.78]|nr:hypothetical protein QBC45DRAFT_437921 [Copromyces sp. CBS 386.78]